MEEEEQEEQEQEEEEQQQQQQETVDVEIELLLCFSIRQNNNYTDFWGDKLCLLQVVVLAFPS